jgi:N-acetylneuraminic acid mutarotase
MKPLHFLHRTHSLIRAGFAAGLLLALVPAQITLASPPGVWSPTGSLVDTHHNGHTATLMHNGRVMVAGGLGAGDLTVATSATYNPKTGNWVQVGSLNEARNMHTATLLKNNMILATGGLYQGPCEPDCIYEIRATAELYNHMTDSWVFTGSMSDARSQHTATTLRDGRVLVTGGNNFASTLSSTEIYDPATGTFTPTGSMNGARYAHTATLLSSGKVLVAGGYDGNVALDTAEIYDPATGVWSPTGSMATTRGFHTETRLLGGKVLVVGGFNIDFPLPSGFTALASAELFNPNTGTWSSAGSMVSARFGHTATKLPDGSVLVAGGESADVTVLNSAELYFPQTNTWGTAADMSIPRATHTATLLNTGKVLVVGGFFINNAQATAEVYTP